MKLLEMAAEGRTEAGAKNGLSMPGDTRVRISYLLFQLPHQTRTGTGQPLEMTAGIFQILNRVAD